LKGLFGMIETCFFFVVYCRLQSKRLERRQERSEKEKQV
jgi:hypothetical protein